MKERTAMKRVKTMMFLLIAVMVLFTMTVDTAEAAAKKSVTVSVKNGKKVKGKYQLTVKKSGQLVVKYAGKNVTKKAKYKVSNKKVAAVSKKGKVTAKKAGSVTVTVKYKGKAKKVKFTVVKPTAVKKGSSGSSSGGGSGGTASKHQHTWKAHKVEDKVWVSKMVEVPVYEKHNVDIEVCSACGARIMINHINPDDPINKEADEHFLNHLLNGEVSGSMIEHEEREILVGTKMEDQGYWKVTGNHVDYYYCSCGAKK